MHTLTECTSQDGSSKYIKLLSWIICPSQPSYNIRLSTYPPIGGSYKSLDCSSFARHYSQNRWLLSIPRPTKMFQFRHLPFAQSMNSTVDDETLLSPGFPIRTSSVQRLLAPPRGLSQPTTSFIGNLRQGIRYMRLCSFLWVYHEKKPRFFLIAQVRLLADLAALFPGW